jgi:hypothetical protein
MSNISTALAIQEACHNSFNDEENIMLAARLAQETDFNPVVIELLMKYTASLSASVATRMTELLMSKSDFANMMSELREVHAFEGLE